MDKSSHPKQNRLWGGLLSIVTLTSIGFSLSVAVSAPISAQSSKFSNDQIRRYAIAARAIERKRQEILSQAKNDPGWSAVASQADSQGKRVCELSRKPPFLDNLCNELYTYSEQMIQSQGFRTAEFNEITNAQKHDSNIRRRIQQAWN